MAVDPAGGCGRIGWMSRWLSLLVVSGLVGIAAPAADAQVFKPKGKKSDTVEKKSARKSPAKKKAGKKKVTTKPRKSAVADRDRSDEDAPERVSKNEDSDYVKITDDDDIE
jgi:hypothetical protein